MNDNLTPIKHGSFLLKYAPQCGIGERTKVLFGTSASKSEAWLKFI